MFNITSCFLAIAMLFINSYKPYGFRLFKGEGTLHIDMTYKLLVIEKLSI